MRIDRCLHCECNENPNLNDRLKLRVRICYRSKLLSTLVDANIYGIIYRLQTSFVSGCRILLADTGLIELVELCVSWSEHMSRES